MVDHNVISSHNVTRPASLSSKAPVELSAAVRYIRFEQHRVHPSNHKTQVNDPCWLVQNTHTRTHTHSQDATKISVASDNTCRSRAQMSLKNRSCRSVANCTLHPSTVKRDHPITCLSQFTFNTREVRSNSSKRLTEQQFRQYLQAKHQNLFVDLHQKRTIFWLHFPIHRALLTGTVTVGVVG
jgi:hypothetical protein